MKTTLGLVLLLTVSNISFGEKEVSREDSKESDSERVVEELELPEGYVKDLKEASESLGVGIEDLIRCGINFTLDGGSHTLIYRFDEEGRLTDTLLFRWSDHDQHPAHPNPRPIVEGEKRTMKVFRETVENRMIRRIELNADEIAHELEEIEKYLIGYVGEEKYRFYYQGGQVDEPDEPEMVASDADPFAPDPPVSAEEMRENINRLNHVAARFIARLIRGYREDAKKPDEGAGKRE